MKEIDDHVTLISNRERTDSPHSTPEPSALLLLDKWIEEFEESLRNWRAA